ncbi:MAG TPA: methyltransferase domain-containing protein [Oscillospiraceae bacterium]|nr:methyltransferase domain-containing protein [Oscillospiraceae bacterium]
MALSRAWDWEKETSGLWLEASEESYYLAGRWKKQGYADVLDFGCGLGRHAVFFARAGFRVSAFDLSPAAAAHLTAWAAREELPVRVETADMLSLPFADDSFDAIFAYHVVSHTDTAGIRTILGEIRRVLRPGGEVYLTLCSKETWSFRDSGYPRLDENTLVKIGGPEDGIPHFYVTLDDVFPLFSDFQIKRIRHIDECYTEGDLQNSKHYFILAGRPKE